MYRLGKSPSAQTRELAKSLPPPESNCRSLLPKLPSIEPSSPSPFLAQLGGYPTHNYRSGLTPPLRFKPKPTR